MMFGISQSDPEKSMDERTPREKRVDYFFNKIPVYLDSIA